MIHGVEIKIEIYLPLKAALIEKSKLSCQFGISVVKNTNKNYKSIQE